MVAYIYIYDGVIRSAVSGDIYIYGGMTRSAGSGDLYIDGGVTRLTGSFHMCDGVTIYAHV